jgi:hypothetical protein
MFVPIAFQFLQPDFLFLWVLNLAFGSGSCRTLNLNPRSGSVRRSNAFEPKFFDDAEVSKLPARRKSLDV